MTNLTAHYWLAEAGRTIDQRGRERDQPDGERSMARAVAIFALASGIEMEPADGWLFMRCLKLARGADADSLLDGIAYAALEAEERAKGVGE